MRDSASDWEVPTWLLIKHADYLLWGFAVSNSVFSPEFDKEEVGRTGLRCFCGVVITDYTLHLLRLPFEIKAFRPVFDHTIGALWKDRVYELPNKKVELDVAKNYIEPTGYGANLNINANVCRLFGSDTDPRALLSAALACKYDVSVAVNVMDTSQICDTKAAQPILNTIMRNSSTTTDITLSRKCSKCGKMVDEIKNGLCTDCQPQIEPLRKEVVDLGNNDFRKTPTSHICKKCYQSVNYVNERELCPNCEKKIKRRRVLIWLYAGIFIVYGVGMCLYKFKKKTIDNQINIEKLENDTVKDTISNSRNILN